MTSRRPAPVRDDDATPGLPARRAALRILDAVLRNGQRLDVIAAQAMRDVPAAPDKALALALAGEVLRWLPDLDALIDSATAQRLADDLKARAVLRIALAQALRLGTPPHAAISTVLPLMEGGPRRLVHGVFGTLMRQAAKLPDVPTLLPAVAARWGVAWGYTALGQAARALTEPPLLDLHMRDDREVWDDGMGGERLAPHHRRLPRGTAVEALPGFADGAFWVQNLSAQIPASLLGPGAGRSVLDLCAAPGGKTMQLANAGWAVTAVESHAGRIERLRENLTRTKLDAEIIHADVMAWEPVAPVDAILLDAPCTATGIFARHPDVLHRIGAKDIAALSALQTRMLTRTLAWLKPGGRLIYATCSLEPEEGEHVARQHLAQIDPIRLGELPPGFTPSPEGWLRILPEAGRDGFFIARFTT